MNVVEYNRKAWDHQVDSGENPWTKPVSPSVIADARKGIFSVLLTETISVPLDWFPPMQGKDVLGLASGGGQQCPIFAAMGANVTVFDNSPRQLEMDSFVAHREGLTNLKVVCGDARDLSCFADGSFDLIFHPVSNLFMPEIRPVWKEAFRVLRHGGTMLSGFLNPVVYIFDYLKAEKGIIDVRFKLPYSDVDHPEMLAIQEASKNPIEFSHSLEEQIGGQVEAGFCITGFYEDKHRDYIISEYTPTYIATRAVKF
jgi:SAM-dependent methyltransferase